VKENGVQCVSVVTYYMESVWNAVGLHAIWNTVFHANVLVIEPAGKQTDDAIIEYGYTHSGHLFDGE
jgi:hypothetical protein